MISQGTPEKAFQNKLRQYKAFFHKKTGVYAPCGSDRLLVHSGSE
jgi:hypothetical protein